MFSDGLSSTGSSVLIMTFFILNALLFFSLACLNYLEKRKKPVTFDIDLFQGL